MLSNQPGKNCVGGVRPPLMLIDKTTAVSYINHLGGTVSPQATEATKNLWMWCLERNISAPPRRGQCQSRPGVQGDGRQVRLDAEPLSLPKDPAQTGPGVGRPVCVPPDHIVGGFFQLETRSTSIGNRCDDARLDRVEGICQPPVGLDRQSLCQFRGSVPRRFFWWLQSVPLKRGIPFCWTC